ncbi:MAG TPA: hypothetical protein VE782_05415, partial [Myxococcaceae bacterium]|nr:hypothetical protein [Myxococcaceae bacterium]
MPIAGSHGIARVTHRIAMGSAYVSSRVSGGGRRQGAALLLVAPGASVQEVTVALAGRLSMSSSLVESPCHIRVAP